MAKVVISVMFSIFLTRDALLPAAKSIKIREISKVPALDVGSVCSV